MCEIGPLPETRKFSTRKPDAAELKRFRAAISSLKKLGLIPKGVDARKAQPFEIRGGKTLREIANKNLSKLTPPKSKLLPGNTPISLRDFPIKGRSMATALKDLEDNYEEIDALKRPDEKWAFEVAVNNPTHYGTVKSYATFSDIRLLSEYLGESAGIQHILHKRQKSQQLFNAIKIVRWTNPEKRWKTGPDKLKRKPSHAARQAKSRKKK